eukprot:scaffold3714_cov104-Phaeocystis_antarctica.AAC.1
MSSAAAGGSRPTVPCQDEPGSTAGRIGSSHGYRVHWARHMMQMLACASLGLLYVDQTAFDRVVECGRVKCADAQHYGSDGRLRARGDRRRKLFGRALRVCWPRLRHSAASTTSRRSTSTKGRLAAS